MRAASLPGWLRRRPGGQQPDPSPVGLTVLPGVTWAGPGSPLALGLACPNCADETAKPHVLTVDFTPPGRARQMWQVVRCPGCTCLFYRHQVSADYAAGEMLTRGRASLYLQQGAGLAQLFRPIARLSCLPGSRVLDIGCGFGFGLDFAVRARGWRGQGMDPAQIAAIGRARLGLEIEPRLLTGREKALHGRFDVVMAAETLEHVPSPPDFLRLLTATLAPGGVLVLTTPDADAVTLATPAGQLAGLLSPELHIVLQTERSLRRLLAQAGFAHVQITRDGGALVATAGLSPLCLADPAEFEPAYLAHLEARAGAFEGDDDLFWGFAGRCFTEAVNARRFDIAHRLRPRLQARLGRFGLDLDDPRLPDETAHGTLAEMARSVPLNLAAILYADAMLALAEGAARPTQFERLACAAEAARRLVRAVGELAMAEPMSEELAWVAGAEALLCAAADPAQGDFAARLRALPPGRDGARRDAVAVRILVTLVNAGRIEEARALMQEEAAVRAAPTSLGRDGAFCRAVLQLQPGGDAAAARDGFAWVRAGLDDVDAPLFWPCVQGELLALDRLGQPAQVEAVREAARTACRAAGGTVPPVFAHLLEPVS